MEAPFSGNQKKKEDARGRPQCLLISIFILSNDVNRTPPDFHPVFTQRKKKKKGASRTLPDPLLRKKDSGPAAEK